MGSQNWYIIQQIMMKFFRFIPSMKTGVVQTFGRYTRLASPGLTFCLPIIQSISIVSNQLIQNQCSMQVRTSDKVFPTIDISLQYRIYPQDTAKAFFQLSDPVNQMTSYTQNTVRRISSTLTLDQLYQSQNQIENAILQNVGPKMKQGGYTIQSVQIKNIKPPKDIEKQMNQINASERRKIAARNNGQAAKIKAILQAQASAQEKALRGKGIADMRKNITQGWAHTILQLSKQVGVSSKDTLDFLFKILQQQTMQTMSKHAGTKVIFTDKSDGKTQRQAFIQALQAHQFNYQSIQKQNDPNNKQINKT